jgi:hypothetical protein
MNEKRRSERIPLDHEIESIFVLQDKFIAFRDTSHKIEVSYSNKKQQETFRTTSSYQMLNHAINQHNGLTRLGSRLTERR